MNRILFTTICLLLQHDVSASELSGRDSHAHPNFVIIMADDLGYGDLSCYGNRYIATPHLDALARGGLRFTDFHSSGAVCSPTRAGLMTGRYQQRCGIPAVISAKNHRHIGLPLAEVTFAEILKRHGYQTALFGKWHLGYQREFHPVNQGFDQFRGYVSGNVDFFSHVDQAGHFDWWQQDQLKDETGYTTELITKNATSFIESDKHQPFCLYLAHQAPHYPYQGPHDKPLRTVGGEFQVRGARSDIRQAYKEMVESMDAGIGEVIAALDKQGLRENTLIWFFSDNGANGRGSNGGLRGLKGSLWEGGHRVPAIANWPSKISPGAITAQTSITLDVFSTLMSIAKVDETRFPSQDGIDLSATLFENGAPSSRKLFWGHKRQRAMRDGDWKLVVRNERSMLFNLREDLAEANDLADGHPDRVQSMLADIEDWERQVGPSTFQ